MPARARAKYELAAEDKSGKAFKSLKANMEGAQKGVGRLLGSLAGLAGGVGFGAVIKGALDAGDRVQKLGIRLDASTEFLSRMGHAAQLSGTDLESVARSIQLAQRAASEAAQGTKQYAEAFDELGIDANKFAQLNPEEQFLKLTEALSAVENSSNRTRLAMETMGRSGAEMLQVMDGGTEGLEEMWREADKLGVTLDQTAADDMAAANDAITAIQASVQGLTKELAVQLAPAIEQVARLFVESFQKGGAVDNSLDVLADGIARTIEAIQGLFGQTQELTTAISRDTVRQRRRESFQDRFAPIDPAILRELDALPSPSPGAGIGPLRGLGESFGGFATGGEVPRGGLYELHQGERVVSNTQTFGDININTQGAMPMTRSQTRSWVRDVLMPEIRAASR